ncbi:endonuclease III [Caldanaerobius polysaccharolyticus]|uniref:endonuclease III n=1 Tax=Caldanaerobius polysaccharolyticus TaxID=44256 RepID=UPI00047E7D44|nr:endonuclease III [Caldanaerobius polysaccharolyticus]
MDKKTAESIIGILEKAYPDARPGLNFNSPFQLLIATILSAQCTDKRVNMVTSRLFKKYVSPEDFANADIKELQEEIKECGLYRSKSKNIIEACKKIVQEYGGNVPQSREELVKLPGVGRKTANVVLSNAFGVSAIGVDTHVFRVANRLGLASSKDVYGTERDLMDILPERVWGKAHHLLIYHGRKVCKARKPLCDSCLLNGYCEYHNKAKG